MVRARMARAIAPATLLLALLALIPSARAGRGQQSQGTLSELKVGTISDSGG
jgi:ABC-type xylose transport system permease subunit